MSTAFEFLKKEERRIKMPRVSVILFMSAVLVFAAFHLTMNFYLQKLQKKYNFEAQKVRKEASIFIAKAQSALPDANSINQLRAKIEKYNLKMAGSRTIWTNFFNTLEKVLPKDSVVVSIKEATTQKPVFDAEDRNFMMTIVVDSMELANSIYQHLASSNIFRSHHLGLQDKLLCLL